MMFALRDDDVSYFTPPEELEARYAPAFSRGVPVSFAVVPYQAMGTRMWTPPGDSRQERPLGENAALVAWLKEKLEAGKAQILLHGCTHRDVDGRPEFGGGTGHGALIERGRRHLEELFGRKVRVFVPPHNTLCAPALAAVKAAGLHLLGGFELGPAMRGWDPSVLPAWLARKAFQKRHGTFFYPFPVSAGGTMELACAGLTPGTPEGEPSALLRLARETGGRFCLATHAWELDAGLKGRLDAILEEALRSGAEFVPAEELFDR